MPSKNLFALFLLSTLLVAGQLVKCNDEDHSVADLEFEFPNLDGDMLKNNLQMDADSLEMHELKMKEITEQFLQDTSAMHNLQQVTEMAYKIFLLEDYDVIKKSRDNFVEGQKGSYMESINLSNAMIADRYLKDFCFAEGKTELTHDQVLECMKHANYDNFMAYLPNDFMDELAKYMPSEDEQIELGVKDLSDMYTELTDM